MLFDELKLRASSLEAIRALGFTEATEIQQKSIPVLLENDIDYVGQAQTGTGKTAAFALPLLEKIDRDSNKIQALILAPTRELANQIMEEINKLSRFEPVRSYTIYGGTSVSGQIRDVKKIRPQILVGTPGRTIDFLERGVLRVEDCKHVILDEADEMLDMGFFEDVQTILAEIPEKRIWMFSATMPRQIKELVEKYFCEPHYVKVTKRILTADAVEQQFTVVKEEYQTEALCRYLDFFGDVYSIVFTKTKIGAKNLMDELNARGFEADSLHGDMSQDQRDCTMKRFKEKKAKLLICTDVAARGIDVNDLTHVINYSLPQDNESYIHRIGRTGRGGSKGIALSIITPIEVRRLRDIERITNAKIEKIQLPKLEELKEKLNNKIMSSFEEAMVGDDPDTLLFSSLMAKFGDRPTEELIKGIYKFAFRQTSKRYENAKEDLNHAPRERSEGGGRRNDSRAGGRGITQSGYAKVQLNMGGDQGVEPGTLLRLISRSTPVRGGDVGKIKIFGDVSHFEVPASQVDKVLMLNGKNWFNQILKVEVIGTGESSGGGGYSDRGGRSRGGRGGNSSRGGSSSGRRPGPGGRSRAPRRSREATV